MIFIDYILLIRFLIPPRLFRQELAVYLYCAIKPIITLHSSFQSFFSQKEFELTWNGQVCMLEELLNQVFNSDPNQPFPPIYITDSIYSEPIFVFNTIENIIYDENIYIWVNSSDISSNNLLYNDVFLFNSTEPTNGFIIHIPIGLVFDLEYFNALVRKYKLPTTQYTIIYE